MMKKMDNAQAILLAMINASFEKIRTIEVFITRADGVELAILCDFSGFDVTVGDGLFDLYVRAGADNCAEKLKFLVGDNAKITCFDMELYSRDDEDRIPTRYSWARDIDTRFISE